MKKLTFFKIEYLPAIFLAVLLAATFLVPAANKFDTTSQMVMVLAFCATALGISFFGFFYREKNLLENMPALKQGRWRSLMDGLMKISLLLYLIWVILSFFYSQTATFGFTEVLMTISGGLLFFSLRTHFLKSSFIYSFLSFLLVISSFFGYIFYFTSHHNRDFGLFFNPAFKTDAWPNAFALFILFLWPLLFSFCWNAKKWIWPKTSALALVFASLILSFSRAGLLVFIFQIIILVLTGLYFFFIKKEHIFTRKKLLAIVFCLIATIALVFGAQYGRQIIFSKTTLSFADKAQFKNGEENTSIGERIDFIKGGLQLAIRQPLFGYGPMSFSYVYRSIQTDWLAIADHPHNIFIKIAVESGIPGALFFFLFLLFLFIKIGLSYKNLPSVKRFLLLITLTAFVGGLAHNLVDYNLNFVTNFLIFWLILGILGHTFDCENTSHTTSKKTGISMWTDFIGKTLLFIIVLFFFTVQLFFTGISFLAKRGFLNLEETQSYLAAHMLYPRYFLLDQAAEALRKQKTHLAEQYYLLHLQKNTWDAMAYNQTGNFYWAKGQPDKALPYFKKTLDLDPKNVWAYYLPYLQILQKNHDTKTFLALSEKLTFEFKQYTPKVEANTHFTAQNDNSKDALAVLTLLMKYDRPHRLLFKEYFDRITAARNNYNTPQSSS